MLLPLNYANNFARLLVSKFHFETKSHPDFLLTLAIAVNTSLYAKFFNWGWKLGLEPEVCLTVERPEEV